MTTCEIYAQGNTGETFLKTIRQRLAVLFTAQPEEPDKDDFEEEFEPMDVKKLPHLYTVSDVQIEAVIREALAKNCDGVYAAGMFKALEILELPS